jgi:outer membrane protein
MKDINMKKFLTALTLTALTTVVNAAGYGVVDLERVVENSSYLKQQNSSFQQKIQPQSTKLDQLSKELQDLQQRLQTGDKLSAADKQKMVTQYQTKMNEFNTLQQTMQSSVQSSIQQVRTVFDGRVKQVAEQLRKENQLDVVLNKNSALAYDAKYDLTDKMIQKVNAIK